MKREIYLAGGCFWGCEKYFSLINGVLDTEVGYCNGKTENPTYEEVCRKNTGHAEAVRVIYDRQVLKLKKLLELYSKIIDPVSVNRQGGDEGTQYRTGVYYTDEADSVVIREFLAELQGRHSEKIAVECEPLQGFFSAEEYHQNYLNKTPAGYCHIGGEHFQAAKSAN